MCGIAGFFLTGANEPDPSSASLETLHSMMHALRHRGPDGDGTYRDRRGCVGHLRLKIIDLSDQARQPMATPDGSIVLSFNGEIYNFRELRALLEPKYQFRSSSDTEVLLHGYAEWGLDVFRRVNGMFAAAIWETARARLVLARDRLGKKPLFYRHDGAGHVVFASELKALLLHPQVSKELDETSLAQYFAFAYVPTPRTIFKGISKVPQGTTITFESGTATTRSFWKLPADELDVTPEQALDELDALLRDAVRIRLESDVPVGFFLSGGIDSTLITAIGKQLAGDLRTFTVGFASPGYDEARHARAIADHLGTRHTEIVLDERDLSRFIETAPTYYDEPFADSSLIATYYLAHATKQHVTVALSGDGGDELFGGYTKYQNLSEMLPLMRAPAALRSAVGRSLQRVPFNTSRKVGHALQCDSVEDLVRWLVSVWKPDELARLMPTTPPPWRGTSVADTWRAFHGRDPLSRFMAADIRSYLCDDILQKVDRASMAVALEIRCPLLDYRIVELAMRLPISLKMRFGTQKFLLRRLLERYVPRRLWAHRPKQGLKVPVKEWYRAERASHISAAIDELADSFGALLGAAPMRDFLAEHLHGKLDYSQKLFAIDSLSMWARMYR